MRILRRGITIIAILLMLGVLAAVIGAMVLAGTGTLTGQGVYTQDDEALYAAQAGLQQTLGDLRQGAVPASLSVWTPSNPAWLTTWQPLPQLHGQFRIQCFPGAATDQFLSGMDPTTFTNTAGGVLGPGTIARIPAEAPPTRLLYVLSTGRSSTMRTRQMGVVLVTQPPAAANEFTIVSQQAF